MKFQRQGDSLVMVEAAGTEFTPPKKPSKMIMAFVLIGAGLILLYVIGGGAGVLSAGIVEVVKWSTRFIK